MTYLAPTLHPPLPSFADLRRANPAMWNTGLLLIAMSAVCAVLTQIDPRTFNGIAVWIKPAKFFGSIGLHLLTLTAALLLLPEAIRHSARMKTVTWIMAGLMIYDTFYIAFRAARAEASHYNETLLGTLGYALMGIAALSVMFFGAWIGKLVLQQGPRTLLARAVGWSFIIATPLTIFTAATMTAIGSHWVGGDQTDATGIAFFHWSTTGGDLRPAHFFSLHLMQIVPAAALTGSTRFTLAVGTATIAAALATYAMALAGIPLIPLH